MAQKPVRAPTPAAPAAGARRVVVLRPGPPPAPKRRWRDLVVGIIGAVLLIASAVLVVALPHQDVLPPQFKVTFGDAQGFLTRQDHFFNTTAKNFDFIFNISEDDVTQIQLNTYFTDDLPASDPDSFSVELYSPDTNWYSGPQVLTNAPPVRNGTAYEGFQVNHTYTFPLKAKPEDTVVEKDQNATADGVAIEQENLNHYSTKGLWRLHVSLRSAGGCPQPTAQNPSTDDALRGAACVQSNSANPKNAREDPGNLFTVGSFSYSYFTVLAEKLG